MGSQTASTDESADTEARLAMVDEQIAQRGIRDRRVLDALKKVPRHRFVPEAERRFAYRDTPLPIGEGQTISQPYMVALMSELVRPDSNDRVLEIGTGSGYQAAVLAEIVDHVYSIELEPRLAQQAERVLRELDYGNVTLRTGDGYGGWKEHAPFDIVIVTAAPDHIPQPLIDQLKNGGVMVVPVGPVRATQELRVLKKDSNGKVTVENIAPVQFVPLRRSDEDEISPR